MKTPQKILGEQGENFAKTFLLKKGLVFLEKNFHAQGGEIDLIFKDPKTNIYIFVEVKTRSNKSFGDIKESINFSKIKKMMRAISAYFFKKMKMRETPQFQIDAIFLQKKADSFTCEHIENIGLDDF